MPRLVPLLSLLLTASCSAPTRPTVLGALRGFEGFPLETTEDTVWVEVRLHPDHARVLGRDFTRDGVLPLAVRIGAASREDGELALSPAGFRPRLYLEDGTVLEALRPAELTAHARLAEAAAGRTQPLGRLAVWPATEEAWIFFPLGDVRVREHYALVPHQDHFREVDLERSLFAFELQRDGEEREVRVGLRPGGAR